MQIGDKVTCGSIVGTITAIADNVATVVFPFTDITGIAVHRSGHPDLVFVSDPNGTVVLTLADGSTYKLKGA